MVDILNYCGCSYLVIPSITRKGEDPLGVPAKLKQDTGITLKVGQWVKYNTTSNAWEKILTTDTLADTDIVGVIFRLKSVTDGKEYGAVSVDTAAFETAVVWTAGQGGLHIKASDTKLFNGSAWVDFAPETHTSLAACVELVPYTGLNGETYYFTFK